jgi:hypothetical protein
LDVVPLAGTSPDAVDASCEAPPAAMTRHPLFGLTMIEVSCPAATGEISTWRTIRIGEKIWNRVIGWTATTSADLRSRSPGFREMEK